MVKNFKEKLKQDGRSLKWFHDTYIKNEIGITYNAFALQLNGYVVVKNKVKIIISEYLEQ